MEVLLPPAVPKRRTVTVKLVNKLPNKQSVGLCSLLIGLLVYHIYVIVGRVRWQPVTAQLETDAGCHLPWLATDRSQDALRYYIYSINFHPPILQKK